MGAGQQEIHILITTYNGHRFIERSLSSALEQTYPGTKIIVYDDGSEDDTLPIVCRMAEAHPQREVVVIEGRVNRRTAYARQKLIEASMELNPDAPFLWLDQDDRLAGPEVVAKVMDQIQKTQADLCLYGFDIEWEEDSPQLKANAVGLLQDQDRHKIVLRAILARPSQTVCFDDYPELMKTTSLGCVKAYGPSLKAQWPSLQTDFAYEDFPPMALLLKAERITALAPDRPVAAFLRRSTSTTGDRRPQHFTTDIPVQLGCFLREVGTSDAAKARAAQGFARSKAQQYETTLRALIDSGRPGFDEAVMEKYKEAVKGLGA